MTRTNLQEHEQEIETLYLAGQTTYEIGEKFGVSPTPVTRVLKARGVPLRSGVRRTFWSGTPDQKRLVVDAYNAGESVRAIATRLKCRATFVIEALDDAGVARRHQGSQQMFSPEVAKQIASEYLAGETTVELGKRYGTNWVTIRNYLLRADVELRAPGVSRFWTEERAAEVVRRYQGGESQQQIAKSIGCAQSGVSDVLREAGAVTRGPMFRREEHPSWKGGRVIDGSGYARVKVPDDATHLIKAHRNGYVLEHRLVMARALGRPLLKTETIHHINGDKQDNRPENLQIRQGRHGKGVVIACLDCGSHNVGAVPLP